MLCCCGAEIAALVVGLLTIDKGVFRLGQWRVVRGTPGYVIGGILAAMLPTTLIAGGLLNVIEWLTGNPANAVLVNALFALPAALVFVGLPVVAVIVLVAGENPNRSKSSQARAAQSDPPSDSPIAPMDAKNPYASPQSCGRELEPDEES
jgi:hypothetical protein